jgi:Icc-related predicted phosphoesterase
LATKVEQLERLATRWPGLRRKRSLVHFPLMKLLVTSDLHLVPMWRSRVVKVLQAWVRDHRPDAVLVAGDLAVPAEAKTACAELRRCFPNGPIALCLGNHDFWVGPSAGDLCRDLADVVQRYWIPAVGAQEITLLDCQNRQFDGLTVCGGYGHYDLGFSIPDLAFNGARVERSHYLSGRPPVPTHLRWRDFDLMPRGLQLMEVAQEQISQLGTRLVEAGTGPILAVVHTPPFESLLGLPPPESMDHSAPTIYAFFRAYLGNWRMGQLLEKYCRRLLGVVCGHTHRASGPLDLGGYFGVNVGSDYGRPRACLINSAERSVVRI